MALAVILGVPVVFHWLQTGEVPVPGQWIFAGTLFCLGLESAAGAFLVGILRMPRSGLPRTSDCRARGFRAACIEHGFASHKWSAEVEAMEQPWLSVVMPIYNGENYLEQALRSILDQEDDRIEVIAVEGGSTDRTADILNTYAHWLPLRLFVCPRFQELGSQYEPRAVSRAGRFRLFPAPR